MADELRDRIAEAFKNVNLTEARDAAQAVIDALGLEYIEGADGEWRYVTAWQDSRRPF